MLRAEGCKAEGVEKLRIAVYEMHNWRCTMPNA